MGLLSNIASIKMPAPLGREYSAIEARHWNTQVPMQGISSLLL
jgi:hypothetical protein